ncbi:MULTISPECIES: response regulator transcription factor [unclassified Synechocystis]|uniref:response regulator transcription factor n=1 Tax=unclassified Synechocystis TaxID=2640012 RepID=UPI00041B431F|nr:MULTISPECIES: response regulator [unclassified Synechocystis]AIE73445.1 two-component response regulator [Synechocystis sp. PCC 6714]MCT0254197.1 response regulator [Synechocystis sp. CS-94]
MKILVVEDNLELLETLNTLLCQAGHVVDTAMAYSVAEWLATEQDYDLLVLDWMLPEGTGLELCQDYRRRGKTTPVLMLTAWDSSFDRLAGLDAGADDYVVKPVDMPELLARVRALGRRRARWLGDCISLGDLSLHR